jgi:hypothetical protein
MSVTPPAPSGCAEFDRARAFLADGRDEEALDLFEVASLDAADPAVRASACAHAAGILLTLGRPWEVDAWAETLVDNGGDAHLARLLQSAARLQFGEVDEARALLADVGDPADPWFPCSATAVRVMRAHADYLSGEVEQATEQVVAAFAADPLAPDVWDAFARLCAETAFDPAPVVEQVPDDRALEVVAALKSSAPVGVDRIVELLWARRPGDPRVLALVPTFAAHLDTTRALEWSARMRASGMGRLCPLLARAESDAVAAPERVRAAALAYASFGDRRAREALERACGALTDDEVAPLLTEVWLLAPALTDSAVVASATTARRALTVAAALHEGGAADEAYAVLVHGLASEDAETLTTDDVVAALPLPALTGLAAVAEARGEDDVAGILESVAVVAEAQV